MLTDLIHTFLNLAAPPVTFFSILLFLPPFQLFKLFLSVIGALFPEDIAGKVVVITGASSGIGESLSYEYAKRGACLVLAARRERSLHDVAEITRGLGSPEVVVVQADVSKPDDCRRIVDQTMNCFGRLDHLVNNAGVMSISALEETRDITDFREIMDTNFWGSVYMTRFAAPYLRRSCGRVIVLSSSLSWLPAPRETFYNASKAALFQFFETLRVEFGPDIGITIVTPGFVESELTQGKFIGREGKLVIDQKMRDVHVGAVPILKVDSAARGIIRSALRGERYVTVPAWFKVTYFWTVFFPEVVEWVCRMMFMIGTSASPQDTIGKKLGDYTGAKHLMYPESVNVPEPKTE